MLCSKLIKILLIIICVYLKTNCLSIEEILEKMPTITDASMMGIIKESLKSQLIESMEKGVEKLKGEAQIYGSIQNKEVIDKITDDLSKYKTSVSLLQEEKYLKSIVENFRTLIRNNENFSENRRMENTINLIEKVMKFIIDKMEEIEKNPKPLPGSIPITIPTSLPPIPTTIDNQVSSTITPPPIEEETFFTTTVIVILSVVVLLLLSAIIYLIARKRVNKDQIEYIPQKNETILTKNADNI